MCSSGLKEHISGQKSWFRPIPADLSNFEKSMFFVIFMIFVKWNVAGIGRKWPESYMICQNRFFGCFRCLLHQKSIFYRWQWWNYMFVKTNNKNADWKNPDFLQKNVSNRTKSKCIEILIWIQELMQICSSWLKEHISGQKSWFRPISANLSNFEKSVFFVIFMIFVKWNVAGIGRKWPEPYIICKNTFSGRFRCLLHQKSIFYCL